MSSKTESENVLEVLYREVGSLQAAKKQLESQIKQLASSVEEAESAAAKKIAVVRARVEEEIETLKASITPHKDLLQQCETAKQTLASVKQALLDETATLKFERHTQLTALNQQIQRASERLGKLNAEEEAFRKRIALV